MALLELQKSILILLLYKGKYSKHFSFALVFENKQKM